MLLLTLVLVAPTLAAPASDTEDPRAAVRVRPTGECQVVSFTPVLAAETDASTKKARRARRRMVQRRRFPATRTLDLQFGIRLRRRVEPDARLELRLYTPRGHLYQTLRVEAPAPDANASGNDRYARLRRILRPRTATLPVAGTAIVNHSLYGRWKVEPHLDGSSRPCGRARSFRIDP
jgi:hypothetical protein